METRQKSRSLKNAWGIQLAEIFTHLRACSQRQGSQGDPPETQELAGATSLLTPLSINRRPGHGPHATGTSTVQTLPNLLTPSSLPALLCPFQSPSLRSQNYRALPPGDLSKPGPNCVPPHSLHFVGPQCRGSGGSRRPCSSLRHPLLTVHTSYRSPRRGCGGWSHLTSRPACPLIKVHTPP